ncbi:Short-chain dehydrogenase/reductase SDR [Candidatus Magnetomorum sp. HK-1]|nr:Short-chain dehydrogenase/reductase SDR [Candidatus Magnetomorum sp. HK-1]
MIGITSYGTYIPRLRLDRMAIFQSMGWFAPAIMMVAQGERSMCNWDEDSITMAVAAARDCLIGQDKSKVDALYLASTTLPYADRQNAGIMSTALNLRDDIVTTDFTASQRVGTTALVTALDSIKGGERNNILVTAADRRETKSAYFYEMWFGDGAAALIVGDKNVIAEYKGSYSLSYDFADHYRGRLNEYDYVWEERWARDEGYSKIIPEAIQGLLDKLNTGIDEIDLLVYPCFFKAEHKKIAKKLGAKPEQVMENLHEMCGETGCAHAMVMLSAALEKAKPGQRILVAGFGQGCNALLFEVTENITKLEKRSGFKGAVNNKKTIDNYPKFLKFRDIIKTEMGIRAEAPTQIAMTTLWRKRKMILGLVGGKCRECQTPQYPKMDICVNPNCNAHHSQDDYEFSDVPAKINSYTGDLLAVSIDPPHKYGMIQFEGGGRFMADFTDCDLDELKVGLPMQLVFRRRVDDKERGLTSYFWKATPVPGAAELMNQVRFDDQVAIITGAGGGLGRIYALELAKRGAKIVVNDLGGSRDGSGNGSTSAADVVVNEIKELGGDAVANYDNVSTVEGGENIVKSAIDGFGRVDIVINNAGILRDKSFTKMEPENWNAVMDVHLNGAYHVSRPAFTLMKEQGYGRIIMTTSAAGLYGNFGQTNYSAAKLALVGLMNTLKIEGAKYNIKVNTIAPLAASRLTEDIMPPDLFAKMKPEFVSPMVLYLASDKCDESGAIFNAGMGYFNRAEFLTGPGTAVGEGKEPPTPEDIKANWDAINSMDGAKPIAGVNEAIMALISPPDPNKKADTTESEQSESITPKDIFERMPNQFKKDAAAGVEVVFQYIISGANGGEWVVNIKDQTCDIQAGTAEKATCILKMKDEDFVDMITGKLKPMQAFTSGKLNISGDVMKSQLIEKLFSMK